MENIQLEHISKKYGERTVLKDCSLTFEYGKITALMGPSGAGKTTIFRILSGLETQDIGCITGVPQDISYVFQENRLCPSFSVISNLRLFAKGNLDDNYLMEQLKKLQLEDFAKMPVQKLSGGMKRRVAILRSMIYGGDLFLLDEPFVGLDDELKETVMDYVKEMTSGKTVIMITHDIQESQYLGAKTLVL